MFGDRLYELTARDMQSRYLLPTARALSVTLDANQVIAAVLTVPAEHVLVLSSFSARAGTGALVAIQEVRLEVIDNTAAASAFHYTTVRETAVNAVSRCVNWSGQALVPSGWTLRAVSLLSAADPANSLVSWLHGLLIPLGNIERV